MKLEITSVVGPLRELAVEGDVGIRLAGITENPQVAGCNFRGLYTHVGFRGGDAENRTREYLQTYAFLPQ
ncbi:hypothetical protein [Methylobacterium sp. E-066]|uniref:hypothetical protein n=1 Tax=Methylobacterium sp. E-066 TaxID=2836584 RepID=UPI001FBA449B|nr:hypothetical protein [Methylobacterium sp. E-066]